MEYDVIVLGSGPVGENVAARAVRGGLSAALVESELLGGECSYWACIPSKALLRSGAALRAARAVPGSAEAVTGSLDADAVLRRRDEFVSHWDDAGQAEWAEGAGITVIRGHGRLSGPRTVAVGDATHTARQAVVICTGSDAAMPPIEGLADAGAWTSREATSASEPPGRLAIVGGGVVGCELAQAWSDLGSDVTLFELTDQLLPGTEPFVGPMVASALESRGVDVRLGASVNSVSRSEASGPTTVSFEGGSVEVDALLVATGRKPRTSDIGLPAVGLEPGTWLTVDDSGRVTAVEGDWLYAVGDVTGQALLTHMGKYAARVCGDAIVARSRGDHAQPVAWSPFASTAMHSAVTSVVFTDPEVASVGLTEDAARTLGLPVRAVELDIAVAGSSLYAEGFTGRAKLLVDESQQVIVGFTAVGPNAGELLHSATIAIVGEVPLERLWHAVPCFPTISEFWLRLLETYGL